MSNHDPAASWRRRTPRQVRQAQARFDREIDQFNKQRQADERAANAQRSREWRDNQAKAKALVPAIFAHDRFAALVEKCQSTPAKVRSEIKSHAHWQPKLVLKMAAEWGIPEQP